MQRLAQGGAAQFPRPQVLDTGQTPLRHRTCGTGPGGHLSRQRGYVGLVPALLLQLTQPLGHPFVPAAGDQPVIARPLGQVIRGDGADGLLEALNFSAPFVRRERPFSSRSASSCDDRRNRLRTCTYPGENDEVTGSGSASISANPSRASSRDAAGSTTTPIVSLPRRPARPLI